MLKVTGRSEGWPKKWRGADERQEEDDSRPACKVGAYAKLLEDPGGSQTHSIPWHKPRHRP